jgi:putative holliday junction resolvase
VTRLLGIDLGARRIGVALAEGEDHPALPLTTIRRAANLTADARAIGRIASEHTVDEIVIGLPLEATGTEGTQARMTRQWAATIAPTVGLPITFRDERLTSHLAEQRLGPMKRGRSGGPPTPAQREEYRARVDREAAAIILQDELDARAAGRLAAQSPRPVDTEASR